MKRSDHGQLSLVGEEEGPGQSGVPSVVSQARPPLIDKLYQLLDIRSRARHKYDGVEAGLAKHKSTRLFDGYKLCRGKWRVMECLATLLRDCAQREVEGTFQTLFSRICFAKRAENQAIRNMVCVHPDLSTHGVFLDYIILLEVEYGKIISNIQQTRTRGLVINLRLAQFPLQSCPKTPNVTNREMKWRHRARV